MKLFAVNAKEKTVYVFIPLKNSGKFRWKTRTNHNEYGKGFPTATQPYSKKSYVEWQIGYDVETSKTDEKPTSLTDLIFVGANKKEKHPYELSEILHEMRNGGLITNRDILNLLKANEAQKVFLDEQYKIHTTPEGKQRIGGLLCDKQNISLPTFAYTKNDMKSPVIEISIQKQQYASGVQPMLYFSIPLLALENYSNFLGKTSNDFEKDPYGVFAINEKNKDFILKIFRLFACCSQRHKYDVNQILKLISNYK